MRLVCFLVFFLVFWGFLLQCCNQTQVQLPGATMKVCFQVLATRKMGDSHLKAHVHLSVEADVFTRREREIGQIDHGKFSTCKLTESIPVRQVMVGCASSWLHIILVPWLKVSNSLGAVMPKVSNSLGAVLTKVTNSLGAVMPEGRSLQLLKSVPKILIQTCCLSTSYTLVRISTY